MIEDLGKYYLYRHIRLDINKVFYVGIGTKKEGKKWSQEFKNKISNSLKGNKLSKESIEKRTNTLKQKAIKRGFYQHEKWKQNIGKSNAKIVYAIINNNFYEFESCHKAEKILNISFQSISYACNKYPKSYKNMYFSYNKDKINQQINKQS